MQPLFDDSIQTLSEKFNVVINMLITEPCGGFFSIVTKNTKLPVGTQFKVGQVEHLIVVNMLKQLQKIVGSIALVPFRLINPEDFVVQVVLYSGGQSIDILVIGVKGSAVDLCQFTDVGDADLIELFCLQ